MATITTTQTCPALSQTAMLAFVHVSMWGGRKLDKQATKAATDAMDADTTAGRFNKCLVRPASLAKVINAAGALRVAFYALTVPTETDARILAGHAYFKAKANMDRLLTVFHEAADDFAHNLYPDEIRAAVKALGSMYRPQEYPLDVRRYFSARFRVQPFPEASDFKVAGLTQDAIAAVRADLERESKGVRDTVRAECASRVRAVCSRMVERLTAYQATTDGIKSPFRDSLITNARDLVDTLALLDVTGDPAIAAMVTDLDRIARVDPGDLRKDQDTRVQTAADAQAVLDKIGAYL